MLRNRGISPAISELILAVIAISLAIISASYILGIWNQQQEEFTVTPMLSIRSSVNSAQTQPILLLHVKNDGTKVVKIVKVEVRVGNGAWVNSQGWTIRPGESVDIRISSWTWVGSGNPPSLNPGDKCRVVVITERIGSLFYDITVS